MAIKPLEDNAGRLTEEVRYTAKKVREAPAATRSSWLANAMTVVLFMLTGVLAFGDMTLSAKNTIDLTVMTIIIYFVTTVVHHSKYDAGVLKGKKTQEYADALARYEAARQKVYDENLATLMPELCVRYIKEELINYRKAIIAQTYIMWDDYVNIYSRMSKDALKGEEELTPEARAAILKANKAKPLKLSADQLLSAEASSKRKVDALGVSPIQKTKIDKYANSITRVFTTFFGCVVAVSFVANPTWENFALWCSRMMPVVIGFILGENAGFTTSAIAAPLYFDGKTDKINMILEWNARGELEEMKREEAERDVGIDLAKIKTREEATTDDGAGSD